MSTETTSYALPWPAMFLFLLTASIALFVVLKNTNRIVLKDVDVVVEFGTTATPTVIRADKVTLTTSWCVIELNGKHWAVIPERCNVLPKGNVRVPEKKATPVVPPLPSADGPE